MFQFLLDVLNRTLVNDVEMKDAVELVREKNEGTLNMDTNLVYFSSEPNL